MDDPQTGHPTALLVSSWRDSCKTRHESSEFSEIPSQPRFANTSGPCSPAPRPPLPPACAHRAPALSTSRRSAAPRACPRADSSRAGPPAAPPAAPPGAQPGGGGRIALAQRDCADADPRTGARQRSPAHVGVGRPDTTMEGPSSREGAPRAATLLTTPSGRTRTRMEDLGPDPPLRAAADSPLQAVRA